MGTKKIDEIMPGDQLIRTLMIASVLRTETHITLTMVDGSVETYELAGDPAIEVLD